ncbi:methyltransferase domain-containing protein [Aquihabitans sp. G128]|uniref:class I SAM-dependent methyltransferase n=1 Tax=Aquihabitans sp. G128 TaxID=2849779 RepID=UPI001C2503B9|nr:methyltransferase domain-containing protein [Aquihabitans sp. G128]QXC59121.1 methyltransferase domain-containing protein [Aquihabitans sp. G128]
MGAARRVRELVNGSPFLAQTTESGWTLAQRALRPAKRKRYLASTDTVRLMIGSGPSKREGWLATDLIPSRPDVMLLDASEPFPFDDASVDRIHTEHMIEHVDHEIGTHMLAECARILKPGGRIRLATPDFDRVVALATGVPDDVVELMRASNERNQIDPTRLDDPIWAVNRLFSGYGHKFLYTESALRSAMEAAGLAEVTRYEVGESDDAEFAEADMHGNQIADGWNRYQTLVLEATKP